MNTQPRQLRRLFARYVVPSILGMVGISCYIFADTLFVSAALGRTGLAALNLAIPVFSLINGLGLMVGVGGSTQYAIARGQDDSLSGNRAFTNALYLSGGLSLLLMLGLPLRGAIGGLLGADAELLPHTADYLGTLCAFAPAFLLNQTMVAFLRADGRPREAMAAMLLGSFSNILLDWVFLFPLGLGMFGAALATGLAPVLSLGLIAFFLGRKAPGFRPERMRPSGRVLRRTGALGLTSLISEMSSGIVLILFNWTLLSLSGQAAVAAYGIVANLSLIVASVFTGIAQGISPLISRSHGQGDVHSQRQLYRWGLSLAMLLGLCFLACGFALPEALIGIFNRGGDPELRTIARLGLPRYFLAFPLMGANLVGTAALAAVDRPRPAFLLSLLRGFVLILPVLGALSAWLGLTGVFYTIPVVEALCACGVFFQTGRVFLRRPRAPGNPRVAGEALARAE